MIGGEVEEISVNNVDDKFQVKVEKRHGTRDLRRVACAQVAIIKGSGEELSSLAESIQGIRSSVLVVRGAVDHGLELRTQLSNDWYLYTRVGRSYVRDGMLSVVY